jgi:cobalamin biosynthesis Mg chelatase CobN
MEKIEILLEKLDNRIPSSLAKRIDTLDNLVEKNEAIAEEYQENPTDDNRKNYNEAMERFEKAELGVIEDLEALLEKRKAEALAKEQKANEPEPAPAPNPSVNPTTETKEEKEEKKGGSGVLTLIVGSVLLVASLGVINVLRKR